MTDDKGAKKILVSKKEDCSRKKSFKYIVGYNDNDYITPVYINLPEMIGYVKNLIALRQGHLRLGIKKLFKKVYDNIGKNQQFNKQKILIVSLFMLIIIST